MKKTLLYTLLPLIALFSGCVSIKKKLGIAPKGESIAVQNEVRSPTLGPQLPTSEFSIGAQQPAKIERLSLPSYERPQPEKPLPELEPIDPKKLVLEEKPVMINVDGMPLSDFITYAIGNTLKVTYFLDEAVKKTKTLVTLQMAKKISAETAFEIAVDILRQNKLIVEQRGGILFILKSRLKSAPLGIGIGRTVPESEARIVQFVPLKYLNPANIIHFLLQIYKKDVDIKLHTAENAFLLSGPAASMKDIISFIEVIDVPYLHKKNFFMIQLTYWQPDEFITQITTILRGIGFNVSGSQRSPGISFIPIKFLNKIIVITPDDNATKVVIEWKEKLDTPEAAGTEEKTFTYKPLYSRASDLVDAIKSLYGVSSKAEKIIQGLKIEADDSRNLVVLITTPSRYKTTLSLLEKLDTPPRQVLIETTIAELTMKDDLQYGLEYFLRSRIGRSSPFETRVLEGLGGGGGGLLLTLRPGYKNFNALISAFAKEDMINILSRPRLIVLDNESATIQVGDEIPVVSSEITVEDVTTGQTGAAASILRNIQYRSTGSTLRIKPTINTEGLLTLAISIELNEASLNTTSGIDSPIILTRRIDTIVAVTSGQSLMLGGIMSEDTSVTVNKVPLLGDIPILGHLFKSTSKSVSKTELIILITPTILATADEATRLTSALKNELKWLK